LRRVSVAGARPISRDAKTDAKLQLEDLLR
jgi:hypothetical protein